MEEVEADKVDKETVWLIRDNDDQESEDSKYGSILFANPTANTSGDGPEAVELIQISSFNELRNLTGGGNRVWQLVPSNLRIGTDSSVLILDQGTSNSCTSAAAVSTNQLTATSTIQTGNPPPADAPAWAKLINDCEKVGHYYRGWVATEQDLDIVLTLHKQQTQSFWGTRQSPAGNRPSARMMWKSQYVPFDGIPFINCGSRAVVMECQFGPRRKGCKNDKAIADFKHACPARIYIKKVRKFPEFAVDLTLDKKALKSLMDQSFSSLRANGFLAGGQDRYYMQLPTEQAHEYHAVDIKQTTVTKTFDLIPAQAIGGTRLVEPVANKIRELVSAGTNHVTTIRKILRKFVIKDLFNGENVPPRHDLRYFPTVNDLQNHIHNALTDIDNGTLALREAAMDTLSIEHDHDWCNWSSSLPPQPETVTVTLTQPECSEGHTISRVEICMSDGSIQVSSSLSPETATLLAKLHPNMFPNLTNIVTSSTGEPVAGASVDTEKITELVHSVLTKACNTTGEGVANQPSDGCDKLQVTSVPVHHTVFSSDSLSDMGEPSIVPTSSDLGEPSDPTPPTEGVQLDLDIQEPNHEVEEVSLENGD